MILKNMHGYLEVKMKSRGEYSVPKSDEMSELMFKDYLGYEMLK